MTVLLTLAAVCLGLPGAATALHLGVLAVASIFYREPTPADPPAVRFLVIVPAHNEERVIGPTLDAIVAHCRQDDVVLVVADRCTDATADIARGAGVEVLERGADTSPGKSAALQAGLRHAAAWTWDAFVDIDADSRIAPQFFEACERVLDGSDGALQARSEAEPGPGILANVSRVAFSIQGVMAPRARDRLGLSVRMRGTGMVLRRDLIERYSYRNEGASEDLWFGLDLCLDGIRARHVDSARLWSQNAGSVRTAEGQRVRWEAGRLLAAREFVPRLLRHRSLPAFEAAVHLITPPFTVAGFLLVSAAMIAAAVGSSIVALTFASLLALLTASMAVAMIEARVPLRSWLSLAIAPAYVVWKLWVQAKAVVGVRRAREPWDPAPRG